MKKVFKLVLVVMMLCCGACLGNKEPETTTITIPESLLTFANTDIEVQLEGCKKYATDAKIVGKDIVMEVTDDERNEMLQMHKEFADELIKEMEEVNSDYKCTLSPDFKSVIFEFDEKLSLHMQAKTMLGVSFSQIMQWILTNNDPNWNFKVTVKNCHTGKIVAECVLPEDNFFIGEKEWAASY